MLATLVNFYNPPLIIIGGGVAASGDLSLAAAASRQRLTNRDPKPLTDSPTFAEQGSARATTTGSPNGRRAASVGALQSSSGAREMR